VKFSPTTIDYKKQGLQAPNKYKNKINTGEYNKLNRILQRKFFWEAIFIKTKYGI
jgi:hypothetical protein